MSCLKENRSLRRSSIKIMGGRISKHHDMTYGHSSRGVVGTKEPPNSGSGGNRGGGGGGGGGVSLFLPSFFRRREKESYTMDATTLRFFHGDANTTFSGSGSNDSVMSTSSDQALPHTLSSSDSSGTGENGSSIGSNEDYENHDCSTRWKGGNPKIEQILTHDQHASNACCVDDYLMYSTDSNSFVDRYGIIDAQSAEMGTRPRSLTTVDSIIDDLLKSQDLSGFKKASRHLMKAKKQQTQIHHPFDHGAASVCSRNTFRSILSTATPFCVFNDDDNNTIISYKVVHQPIFNKERHFTEQNLGGFQKSPEESLSSEIQYPHCIEDFANRHGHVPIAASNHHGVGTDVWSSNWNEMYDNDSITSAGTILHRTHQQQRPQQEIVFVRSKYSYAQENALRLNRCKKTKKSSSSSTKKHEYWNGYYYYTNDNETDYNFPWDAYKEAISSSGTASRQNHAAYALVEL